MDTSETTTPALAPVLKISSSRQMRSWLRLEGGGRTL